MTKDKLRELEDHSWRDNLRLDGIPEYENESWAETEYILKDMLSKTLGIRNIQIVRAHRLGNKSKLTCRTIFEKFSNFRMKERILEEAKKKKLKDI